MCPLIVDPSSLALKWLKTHFKDKNVEIVSQDSKKFNNLVELAVRFGKILIVEEVENVSPILLPLIRKEYTYHGERQLVNFNGKLIEHHNNFRLILCSRNDQMKLNSDVNALISVINFKTTHAGLTEQLLINAIRQENPELEERRKFLLSENENLQEQQYNLKKQLLDDLTNATGDLLQNAGLIKSLNETKSSSKAITEAIVESEKIQEKLQQEYSVYKNLAAYGSSLYFAAEEFAKINVLYSISIPSYTRIFLKCLPNLNELSNNLDTTKRTLLQALYKFMSRGLFKTERLKFALHLVQVMQPNQITAEEWNLFLGKTVSANKTGEDIRDGLPNWLPESALKPLYHFKRVLPNLYDSLKLNDKITWSNFMERLNCEVNFPPHCKLTDFQKVLLVQALRPDRLYQTIINSVLHLTGLTSLDPEVLQMKQLFNETVHNEPVLFITTSGSDPSSNIRTLHNNLSDKENLIEISMGQGQEERVIKILNDTSSSGNWVVIKNIHLSISWLPILCQNLQNINFHKNYRLWLISESHQQFSPVLAQNSLKIVCEPPEGIRNNLLKTYSTWQNQYIEKLNPINAKMFFVLACVHALVQERRKYIPQGWSKFYDFGDNDLSTAVKLTEQLFKLNQSQVQWNYLIGWCSQVIYGGRIENHRDLSVLDTYLYQYFNDAVLSNRWKPFDLNLTLPTYSNFEEYIQLIEQLPGRDKPVFFGLPENIDRIWEANATSELTLSLKDLSIMRTTSAKNRNVDDLIRGIGPFLQFWKKLNQGHDFIRVSPPPLKTEDSPIAAFISMEYSNAVTLVQTIHKYFANLNKILKGAFPLSEEYAEVADNLLKHQTPNCWIKLWEDGSKDPLKFLQKILDKTIMISEILKNDVLNHAINLKAFFNPDGFLAAFKQDYSRLNGVPIDELTLKTSWNRSESNKGLLITGLLMEGGLFDGRILQNCLPDSQKFTPAPDCYLSWIKKIHNINSDTKIEIPLYCTMSRQKLLTLLEINADSKQKYKWIQASFSFFTDY